MESQQTEAPPAPALPGCLPPLPRPLGLLFILIAALSLAAGLKQGEPVTILIGAVLGLALAYAFGASLFLFFLHREKARRLSIRMAPEEAVRGRQGSAMLSREGAPGKFFRLPGILIRCGVLLRTVDSRRLELIFDPDRLPQGLISFTMPLRGAYSGQEDRFFIMDITGFFRASVRLSPEKGIRLRSMPEIAEMPFFPETGGGGEERRSGQSGERQDTFIDHRPYAPGDDPRRINWKLYGHSGDLFIREGEREPPPHARLLLLIDTGYDPHLYSPEAGSRGVDLLCENALALIAAYKQRGLELSLGYSGSAIRKAGTPAEFAALLAEPAALAAGKSEAALPRGGEAGRILILALPRERTGQGGGLEQFLQNREQGRTVDLVFFAGREEYVSASESCAAFYAKKPGIRAFSVNPA